MDTQQIDVLRQRTADLEKELAIKNRELQIEAALEKVRTRAMAMHESNDLKLAVAAVFEELEKVNPGLLRCGIAILDKERPRGDIWITVRSAQGNNVELSGGEALDTHPLLLSAYGAWRRGEDFFYMLQGDELLDYYKALHQTAFQFPIFSTFHGTNSQQKQFYFNAVFDDGSLFAFTNEELSEATKNVMKRFAGVLNLTYKRFLDLQKAEAQARRAEQDLIEIKAARKKAEEALSALKATQQQLIQQEKMASLGELTAGIAHEIQNPLNFVNNFSAINRELIDELLQANKQKDQTTVTALAADIRANEEKIAHHGQRADSIVKGMLQHARASSGKKGPTDINRIADEYLRLSYQGMRTKDKAFSATVEAHFDTAIGEVHAVPQDIGRVLLNLYNNAFYAVNEKKKQANGTYEPIVSVTTKREKNHVTITIKDNGTGMSQNVVKKIFQPFFTTKPAGEGTGLGLSLSYDIITKGHGGNLTVQSTEGEGAEFVIELPVQKM